MSRFFGLVGVAIPQDDRHERFVAAFTALKRDFLPRAPWADRDEVCVLHREDIVNRTAPHFSCLRDVDARAKFNQALLKAVADSHFVLYGVVLDKQTHHAAQHRELADDYHYAMLAMLERYCGRMDRRGFVGDVMAEARGGGQDRALKNAFRLIADGQSPHGRYFKTALRARLTSKEIKLKAKRDNILGLQLADLLARDVTREILASRGHCDPATGFGAELQAVLAHKYNRHFYNDRVDGYGRVFLE